MLVAAALAILVAAFFDWRKGLVTLVLVFALFALIPDIHHLLVLIYPASGGLLQAFHSHIVSNAFVLHHLLDHALVRANPIISLALAWLFAIGAIVVYKLKTGRWP